MSAVRLTAPALLLVAGLTAGAPAAQVQAAVPTCAGQRATLVGTARSDDLVGTRGRDVIVGRAGDDVINGRGGNDLICGGADADELRGGPGGDSLHGSADRLGSDVTGTFLVGDVLLGGRGDDRLLGGFDDRSAQARRRPDTVSWMDSPRGVVVDLVSGTATGFGTDTIPPSTRLGVQGSPYADQITGSARPDVLAGQAGDDQITAGGGADKVFTEAATIPADTFDDDDVVDAGPGPDLVSSQAGQDRVLGGEDDDFIEAYSPAATTVLAGAGDDYVAQDLVDTPGAHTDGGTGIDRVALYGTRLEGRSPRVEVTVDLRSGSTSSNVVPAATGRIGGYEQHRLIGNLAWVFHGRTVVDRVWAITGGPLRAWTYAGNDTVTATDRVDFVDAGLGIDVVWGRGGADTCRSAERGTC
ncbi:MAG: calcium-binding protein [Nocardioides sp.]